MNDILVNALLKLAGCGYKTKTHNNTKITKRVRPSDVRKIASMATAWKKLQAKNPYMPYIQDNLNRPAMQGLDKLLGRAKKENMPHIPNKYDGIRSRLKNLFNSLPGGK